MKLDYGLESEPKMVVDDINTVLRECVGATGKNDAGELEILSRACVQLPALMNSLGYYLAIAEIELDTAKDYMDYERNRRVDILPDVAVNRATIQVEISDEYRKIVVEHREAKKAYKLLRHKYEDVDRQFEGIRSRLSVIKNDLRRNDE